MSKIKKCPICQKTEKQKYWAMPGYRLAKCKSCGMVWDPLPPNNFLTQYEENYFINENPKGGYANYFEGMVINKRTFSDRLKKIEKKLGRKGKLLDVGCALGDCLLVAKDLGWKNVEGLEVSKYAYEHTQQQGLKVTRGTLGKSTYQKNFFDCVTYQDTIEHITNPVEELEKVRKILKPGGFIYIVTPDVGGYWAKILRSFWYHYKPGEHVVYFSENTIKKALVKAGFINIKTQRTYHVLSLQYIFNRLKYYSPFIFTNLLRIIGSTRLKNIPFKLYTGELEAWGRKPL